MAYGFPDGAGAQGLDRESWRVAVLAIGITAISVSLGGLVAIAAALRGASTVVSLSLMAAVVAFGVIAAVMVAREEFGEQPQPVADEPGTSLEAELSSRYGVRVQRVAWHVWRIDGELVEATYDEWTGRLMTGRGELRI